MLTENVPAEFGHVFIGHRLAAGKPADRRAIEPGANKVQRVQAAFGLGPLVGHRCDGQRFSRAPDFFQLSYHFSLPANNFTRWWIAARIEILD